jgi:DNA polymerase III subunit epsilon
MRKLFNALFMGSQKKISQSRERLLAHHQLSDDIRDYLLTAMPSPDRVADDIDWVAVDFETTGVDSKRDKILSIGIVPFRLGQIDVSQCLELLIDHGQFIDGQSAAVNHIVPKTLRNGYSLDAAMDILFSQMTGKALLLHGACIEMAFIDDFMLNKYGVECWPRVMVDTLYIEKNCTYAGKMESGLSFQLNDVRTRYGLPQYESHSAAIDALATAELFIAQLKSLFKSASPSVSQLL